MNIGGTTSSTWCRVVKIAFVVVITLVLLVGIMMALMSLKQTPKNSKISRKDDSVHQAMSIKHNMDTSVNPCEHFFNFTCGNYQSEVVGSENWAQFANKLLYERYLDTVSSDTQKFILPADNLKAFHKACVNIFSSKTNYNNDLKNVLEQLQWPPLTNNWEFVAARFNWLNLEEKLIKMGFTNSLLKLSSVGVPEEMILCDCGPPSTVFDLTNEEEAKKSIEYLIGLLDGEQKYANEILQVLIEIQKIKVSNILPVLEGVTLGELEERWKIDFFKFCISILPSYMNITKSTYILLKNNCPARLIDFLKQIKNRPVAGYMLIEGIAEFGIFKWFTDGNARKINREYKKLSHHKSTNDVDKDVYCYSLNMKLLPDLWLYIYVKRYSSKATKDKVLKMLNLIREEGRALIKNSWLSDSSKKVISNKFSKQIYMIDHDEEFVTDKYIQSTFGDLKFNGSDMIKSVMHLKAHRFLRQWKIFTVKYEKREIFRQHAELTVNAFNDRVHNFLTITAPCLIPMLYSDEFEDSLNFGGLGSILAHELFHTIDHASLQFDDNHSETSWLNEQDKILFDDKVNCFVQQYSNYKLTSELHVDGYHTVDENLADSGIILAYRAYLKWLETNEVKQLPGLSNYNNRQIFWIALGNIWCTVYNKEYLESNFVKIDIHAIAKFRILGTLSNFEEFSKDFNCSANSSMNPKNKCKLYH